MNIQKINWKVFIADPSHADPDIFFKVFNAWIPDSPEVFVDVADYRHAHDGPLTALVGHYEDYWLDTSGRRAGLLYNRRLPMEGTNEEKIRTTFRSILNACRRIEQNPAFGGRLKFRTDEFLFLINDRGLAPNTKETYAGIKPDLEKVMGPVFDGQTFSLDYLSDPKQRFSVKISLPKELPIQNLLNRI